MPATNAGAGDLTGYDHAACLELCEKPEKRITLRNRAPASEGFAPQLFDDAGNTISFNFVRNLDPAEAQAALSLAQGILFSHELACGFAIELKQRRGVVPPVPAKATEEAVPVPPPASTPEDPVVTESPTEEPSPPVEAEPEAEATTENEGVTG